MAADSWSLIHAERQALIEDLTALTAEQWATPSLCAGWTVHDVTAHLVSSATLTPPAFVGKFIAAGFSFSRFAAAQVESNRAGGPAATLAAFRAAAGRTSSPPGPKPTWLGENLVHGEDIRRPLGIVRSYPLDAVTQTITFYAGSEPLIHGKSRVAGLQLRATDTSFSVGAGLLVEGPAMSLLLAAAGRKAALADLTGPGVGTLRGALMTKASPELLGRFDSLLDLVGDADRKLVFGCPSCLVGGNMSFGVHQTGLFVKLDKAVGEELLASGGRPFEPMPGRAMGGFFVLPEGDVSDWVRQSYDYAKTLPVKKKKR